MREPPSEPTRRARVEVAVARASLRARQIAGGRGAPAGLRTNQSRAGKQVRLPVATRAQAESAACSWTGEASCQSGAEQEEPRPIAGGGRVRPVRAVVRGPIVAEGVAALRHSRAALSVPGARPSAAPRHARRCSALVPGAAAARPPEAAPTVQSQRDGGSHGAGARQPSPRRCHVQLRRRRRLSGAGHPDSHAGGARAAAAAPGGTRGVGRGKGRRGRSRCPAELTLGCEQRRDWGQGSG